MKNFLNVIMGIFESGSVLLITNLIEELIVVKENSKKFLFNNNTLQIIKGELFVIEKKGLLKKSIFTKINISDLEEKKLIKLHKTLSLI